MKLATDESMVLQESDVYHCMKSTFVTNMFACMFACESANAAKQIFACDVIILNQDKWGNFSCQRLCLL